MIPSEAFLSYLWKYQKFDSIELKGTKGEHIQVLKPGVLNHHAGPDFLLAELVIDGTKWHGSVELHVKASDWEKHGHSPDPKYANVILHVVWEDDKPAGIPSKLHTLEVKNCIDTDILMAYEGLLKPYQNIPCEANLAGIDLFKRKVWLSRMLVERLELKTRAIQDDYIAMGSDITESFYRLMCKAFGQKVNEFAFDQLSRNLPAKLLLRYTYNLSLLEALLFGVAGFLEEPQDGYMQDLQGRFQHLKSKHKLVVLPKSSWNFMRMRPSNFPTVRIAQLAALFAKSSEFLRLPTQSPDFDQLKKLLKVKASPYWDTHYNFSKESEQKEKWISDSFFNHLIINVFVPFVFFYKRRTGGASIEWVEEILSNIPPEENSILRKMTAAGFDNSSADKSQSLYHLHQQYCSQSKCLSCALGNSVLNLAVHDR